MLTGNNLLRGVKMETLKKDQSLDKLVYELTERAKEFNCLYEIQPNTTTPMTTIRIATGRSVVNL